MRQDLLSIIKERGYRRLDEPIRLASGALSSDFIDGAGPQFEQRGIGYYPMSTYESLGIEPVRPPTEAATTPA